MLAIYTRLSKEDADSTSIKNQLREGKEFAKKNGFNNFKVYNEGEGVSGTWDIDKRPQLYELIIDIRKNRIHAVWFRNENRLGRNMETYVAFLNVCIKSHTKIFFAENEFDYKDPIQDLVGNILSSLNSYSTKLQSKQTKKALLDNIKLGKSHGLCPYGYKSDVNGYLIVDKRESKIIKRIFKDHSKGKGCRKIANELNVENVPTKKSKSKKTSGKWQDMTIRSIIRNSIYYGRRNWKGQSFKSPAIVSKKLWEKSNKAFETNQNNQGKMVCHEYLLNKIIKCGVCGRGMYGKRRVSGKDNAYVCAGKRLKGDDKCNNRSINIFALEEFIWKRFIEEDRFKELINEVVEKNQSDKLKLEVDIIRVSEKIEELTKEKNQNIKLVIKAMIDENMFESNDKLIKKQIEKLKRKKNKLEEDLNFFINIKYQEDSFKSQIKQLNGNSPFHEKQNIIHKFVKSVDILSVNRDHLILIQYNFPFPDEFYLRYKLKFYNINDIFNEPRNI